MPTPELHLLRELPAYGILRPTLLNNASTPETVDYLDLIPVRPEQSRDDKAYPDAVAENQGRPLLYVVTRANLGSASQDDKKLKQLLRTLGSRGERSYLAVLEPGQISVTPVSLSMSIPKPEVYTKGTGEALTFFSRLSLGEYGGSGEPHSPDYVYDKMFELLEHSADRLAKKLDKGDVLSLIGRALFFRFLCDREIVKPGSLRSISPKAGDLKECFDNPVNAAATCSWLDNTFNGDFLPLTAKGSLKYFERIGQETKEEAFEHLSAIIHGHEPLGTNYQHLFSWALFDFAHVPVGLLSQVYEAFSWKWSPDAKGTSVHYTPKRIADYLVEEAFHGLTSPHTARVLDPACGAGIFLVLAFRRLYQARWKTQGQRPDTKSIREILETQLTGFDVSESALRLAALSLYLTAIELDPEPVPPSKLAFKNLRDRVLFDYRRYGVDPNVGPVIGSLGKHVGKEHEKAYDMVLCNPPWTSLDSKHKDLAAEFTTLSREVLVRRGLVDCAVNYQNPDNVPDLPFVWRATEWCRPGGRIGMVLPGRNLFKQEALPRYARETLFRALTVNGILNCSSLSDTKVWPGMNQPFLLLFACNLIPKIDNDLRWVTPHCDVRLNGKGEVRIDSKSSELVNIEATFNESWLWKALAIGTQLDVEVVRKVKTANGVPLRIYWEAELGARSSNGYQIKSKQPQTDARFLRSLKDLNSTQMFRFIVDTKQLGYFDRDTAFRPRTREIYRAPLLLVRGFPEMNRESGLALLSLKDVAFNESFDGYSAAGLADGEDLVRYLHLFVHSIIWQHYVLLTTPKLGVERREFYKSDLDSCPVIPFARLSKEQKELSARLSNRLIGEDATVFKDIDVFFATLYKLNNSDLEVMRDTLLTALPYNEVRVRACEQPTPHQKKQYVGRLASLLRPFFDKLKQEIEINFWESQTIQVESSPYSVLLIGNQRGKMDVPTSLFFEQVLPLANESGATRVFFGVKNGMALAILNQQRYWTASRARLCASEILLHHMEQFER